MLLCYFNCTDIKAYHVLLCYDTTLFNWTTLLLSVFLFFMFETQDLGHDDMMISTPQHCHVFIISALWFLNDFPPDLIIASHFILFQVFFPFYAFLSSSINSLKRLRVFSISTCFRTTVCAPAISHLPRMPSYRSN